MPTTLTLDDLPPAPPDKTGWPWTEQTEPLAETMLDGSEWPQISIVTPSYKQGKFIEETIRSVLLQGYPNLEFIIIDGGSTDETLAIIHKYEHYLAYWVSERDHGQSHALNKGLQRATGELIGWQNSDDYYAPRAFQYAAETYCQSKDRDVIYGSVNYIDESRTFAHLMEEPLEVNSKGTLIGKKSISPLSLLGMIPFAHMANQSMFFNHRIFQAGEFINEAFQHAMDYEFFWRLINKKYKFCFVPEILGYYRLQANSKGCQPENVCQSEMYLVYQLIYQNLSLPLEVREKAWLHLRGLCLDHYGKLRLQIFRKTVAELVTLRQNALFDLSLLSRYVISFLGTQNIQIFRTVKNQLRIPTAT